MTKARKKMIAGALLMAIGAGIYMWADSATNVPPASIGSATRQSPISLKGVPEVTVFFWYGCPHCLKLENSFREQSFESQISFITGKNDSYKKVAVPLNPLWEKHARLFYSLERLGMSSQGHYETMLAIQDSGASSDKEIEAILDEIIIHERERNTAFNANPAKVVRFMYAPFVNENLETARRLSKDIALSGVPTILVNGEQIIELGGRIGYKDVSIVALELLKSHE